MNKEYIKKRIENKGYKVTECMNGRILISSKTLSRIFDSYNQIARYFGWRNK